MKTKHPGKWGKFSLPESTAKPRRKAPPKRVAVKEAKEKLGSCEKNFDALAEE